MVRTQTVNAIVLVASLAALALGVLKLKENLIVPAFAFSVLMAAAVFEGRKGKSLKVDLCIPILLTLSINAASAFWTFERYTDSEWLDFLMVAPSYTVAAYSIVLSAIAYLDIRLDRLLFFVFTVFATFTLSSSYTFIFAAVRFPIPEADLLISNYYLNASSFTIAVVCIASVFVVNRYLIRKKINLLYPRHVLEYANGGGE